LISLVSQVFDAGLVPLQVDMHMYDTRHPVQRPCHMAHARATGHAVDAEHGGLDLSRVGKFWLLHIFMTQPKPFYYTARNAFGRSTRVAYVAGICISERAAMRKSRVCHLVQPRNGFITVSRGTRWAIKGRTGKFSAPTGEISQVRLSGDGEPLKT
jgi:hypothetical protein